MANVIVGLPTPGVTTNWGSASPNGLNAALTALDNVFAAGGNGTSVGINVGAGKTITVAGTANFTGATVSGLTASQVTNAADVTAANTFLQDQTVSTASGGNINLNNTTSPGSGGTTAGKLISRIFSSTSVQRSASVIFTYWTSATNAAESSVVDFWTMISGTLASRMILGAGLYTANATGGDKGADSINAKAYYIDGVATSSTTLKTVRLITSGVSITLGSTTNRIFAELIGAGGGNASGATISIGSAGGYCAVTATVTPGGSLVCAIGAGSSNATGGNTTLTIGATTYTASGGAANGGTAGTGTNGDINKAGMVGVSGSTAVTNAIYIGTVPFGGFASIPALAGPAGAGDSVGVGFGGGSLNIGGSSAHAGQAGVIRLWEYGT